MASPRRRSHPPPFAAALLGLLLAAATPSAGAEEAQDEDAVDANTAASEEADVVEPTAAAPLAVAATAVPTPLELRRPRAEADRRTLRYHGFRDPQFGASAMTAGSFAFRPGMALARVAGYEDPDGPVYDLGLGGGSLDLALSIPLHEIVALRLHGAGWIALGTNEATLANVGGAGVADVDGDVAIALWRAPAGGTQLTALVGGAGRFGLLLDPSPVAAIPDGVAGDPGAATLADPITRTREWGAGGGLAVAHAFNRHVALQGSAEARGGALTARNADLSDTDPLMVITGAASLDLDAWPHVPIAVQLAYGYEHRLRWLEATTVQSRGAHLLGGGVYFSGAPQSTVGVTASGRLGSDDDPYGRLARVDLVFQRFF